MVRKSKNKKARSKQIARDLQWKQESKTLRDFQRKAPHIKKLMRLRGLDLPFYDYLDSYPDEFHRIADAAVNDYPSLLGVHEVDEKVFGNSEAHWDKLGYGGLEQVFFGIDDELADYGRKNLDANLSGSMTTFLTPNGDIRSVILIKQSVKASVQHGHLKYALKIAALHHEIGHVLDLEQGTNFDVKSRTLDVLEAETFAHLFALESMAKRNQLMSYDMLFDALKEAVSDDGYLGKIAAIVVQREPQRTMVDWNSQLEVPLTSEELKKLGSQAIEALSN